MNESIPEEIGVIVLPGTVLFPKSMLPLYIFEPRYREMLDHALESHRVFAVGTLRPGGRNEEPYAVGGAGVIRACVRNDDGTSNLVLQGLRRVRFLEWTRTEPYRIARVEALESRNVSAESPRELLAVVKEICAGLDEQDPDAPAKFEAAFARITDSSSLTDLITAALVADPDLQRELIEELDVPTRMRAIMRCLRKQLEDQGRP